MEKSAATTTVSMVGSDESSDVQPVSKWSPGYRDRFPYIGAIALACIAVLAGVALGVLIGSDGVSTTTWPQRIAPNVVLSAINALSSLALALAVGEGVAIAWWRMAMKGSTVEQLHHQWELSGGIYALLTRPKSLFTSSIALAVLATQVTILNSILYQRATSSGLALDPPKLLTSVGIAAQDFPSTGYVVSNTTLNGRAESDCFMIGDTYTPVVNNWQTANGFFNGYNELFRVSKHKTAGKPEDLQYCKGICLAEIEAIGFEIDCTESQDNQDIAIPAIEAYNDNGDAAAWTDLPIFNSTFTLDYMSDSRNYSQISIDLRYFQSEDPYNPTGTSCPGTIFTKQCSLRPAIISYPVKITNFTNEHVVNGVELRTPATSSQDAGLNVEVAPPKYDSALKQAEGFSVVRYLYPQDTHELRSMTSLGGIANAISQYLASTAAITYTGVDDSWSLDLSGTLAGRMMFGPPNMGTCDCSFRSDSLDIIINSINQLTFMTATGLVDTSGFIGLPKHKHKFPSTLPEASVVAVESNTTAMFAVSTVQTTQLTDVVHYKTHYVFAGIAFGITILCIILVIPSFWHYGQLGRKVTLGPMEIASAFGAPILIDDTPKRDDAEGQNENIDTLIRHIGDRKIVYGFVDVEEDGHDVRRQEMHLDNGQAAPRAASTTHSPAVGADSPMPSSNPANHAGGASPTSNVHKRRSVRLAIGDPERVRPTSQVFSAKSPKIG